MKISNAHFENTQFNESLKKISDSEKLTVLDAYRINRLIKTTVELYDEYQKLKSGLLKKYGAPVPEDGEGMYRVNPENIETFQKEMADLLAIEHDMKIELLPFPQHIDEGITVSDIEVLSLFFDFGFDEEEKENPPTKKEDKKE